MKQIKRTLDLLSDAAGHAGIRVNGTDERQAMIHASTTFSTLHQHHFTAAQGWQFLVQYHQARLAQDPTNLVIVNELLIAIAHASEECQHSAYVLDNAPVPTSEHLDHFWTEPHSPAPGTPLGEILIDPKTGGDVAYGTLVASDPAPIGEYKNDTTGASDLQFENVAAPASAESIDTVNTVPEPAAVEPEPVEPEKMPSLSELERKKQEEEDAAWNERDGVKKIQVLPDEIIKPGFIVKEYKNPSDFRSGWWREGYPYKIVVYPQPGAPKDAPEYFIHCAERPNMELFGEHAKLYHDRICYIRVKVSDGEQSFDVTREFTNPKANPTVAKTALKKTVDDNWTQDSAWRIRYHDVRVGYECFEYFDYQPGGMLLNKYHRGKHFAKVESREQWVAELRAANLSPVMS